MKTKASTQDDVATRRRPRRSAVPDVGEGAPIPAFAPALAARQDGHWDLQGLTRIIHSILRPWRLRLLVSLFSVNVASKIRFVGSLSRSSRPLFRYPCRCWLCLHGRP